MERPYPNDNKARLAVRAGLGVLCALALLSGCATVSTGADPVALDAARGELPEAQLLDVGVVTFDPGIPEDPVAQDKLVEQGISPAIRKAESRYVAVHLRDTLQRSGHWGAVRVVPSADASVEVEVRGKILVSDGEALAVQIRAIDATGREWFTRRYEQRVHPAAYRRAGPRSDPFQGLYNEIANDLAVYRAQLSGLEAKRIREISELRFAAEFAPDVYYDYVSTTDEGRHELHRLPAHNDPMLVRIRKIREREYMLVDTVNGHYEHFYQEMEEPYRAWREARGEEMAALRDVKRQSLTRKLLGAAAIIGGATAIAMGGSEVQNLGLLGAAAGVVTINSGIRVGETAIVHEDAIHELRDSFEDEVAPLEVQVEGETVELTGSAEVQYEKWRGLLKGIYASETGFSLPPGNPEEPHQDGFQKNGPQKKSQSF